MFHSIPHEDDDLLDPFQYRLMGHYRRVWSERGGVCEETTRETAEVCRMSVGKVVQVRRQLAEMGRIRLLRETDKSNAPIIVLPKEEHGRG